MMICVSQVMVVGDMIGREESEEDLPWVIFRVSGPNADVVAQSLESFLGWVGELADSLPREPGGRPGSG
jgi:hypothetical protein